MGLQQVLKSNTSHLLTNQYQDKKILHKYSGFITQCSGGAIFFAEGLPENVQLVAAHVHELLTPHVLHFSVLVHNSK